ncbi:hypothetical protein EVAR_44692_1 [Eumeta japonica]|uniref:Uncharacterized protein n=1 Tax=Eumeta variegata TaxID=151549 RepID=A0A4C1XKN5_EUMVA|nr:hypothetical protein EVAR_44692_1 [Eumeta japonica]
MACATVRRRSSVASGRVSIEPFDSERKKKFFRYSKNGTNYTSEYKQRRAPGAARAQPARSNPPPAFDPEPSRGHRTNSADLDVVCDVDHGPNSIESGSGPAFNSVTDGHAHLRSPLGIDVSDIDVNGKLLIFIAYIKRILFLLKDILDSESDYNQPAVSA